MCVAIGRAILGAICGRRLAWQMKTVSEKTPTVRWSVAKEGTGRPVDEQWAAPTGQRRSLPNRGEEVEFCQEVPNCNHPKHTTSRPLCVLSGKRSVRGGGGEEKHVAPE